MLMKGLLIRGAAVGRRSGVHEGVQIGRRLGLPVVVPEFAVVDSRTVVGAGCGADSLSFSTGNSRLR